MPLSKMDTDQAKAARAAAKAKWDKMTPEEKAAYKKAASQKKREELTAMEAVAADQGPVFDAKKAKRKPPRPRRSRCRPRSSGNRT